MAFSGSGFCTIRFEGVREAAQALKEIDADLLRNLREQMREVGNVIRDDARARAMPVNSKTAMGYSTTTSLLSQSAALVSVRQRVRRTTGKRPDYGSYQMRHFLLPARAAQTERAYEILEKGAYKLLREHGF